MYSQSEGSLKYPIIVDLFISIIYLGNYYYSY